MGTLEATQSPLSLSFLVCLMELNHDCLFIRKHSFAFRRVTEQSSYDHGRRTARKIDETVDQRSGSKLASPELKDYCFSSNCFSPLGLGLMGPVEPRTSKAMKDHQ